MQAKFRLLLADEKQQLQEVITVSLHQLFRIQLHMTLSVNTKAYLKYYKVFRQHSLADFVAIRMSCSAQRLLIAYFNKDR